MSHLPVGWTVTNKDGAQAGPARRPSSNLNDDGDSGSEGDEAQGLDIAPDSPGWEDMEADEDEDLNVKCLLCEQVFPQSKPMLDHCSAAHGLDLLVAVKKHGLDFYGTIKLVNYVRSSAAQSESSPDAPDTSSPELWKDDRFLQPVLENDALLFSLDELVEDAGSAEEEGKVADWDEAEALRKAREEKSELEDVPE